MCSRSLKMFCVLSTALLFSTCKSMEKGELQESIESIKKGDLHAIQFDITARPQIINAKDEDGNSLLHWAAEKDKSDIIEYLLKKKANVDIKNNKGVTPLHKAVLT